MCGRGTAYIYETESLTEAGYDTIFSIVSVDVWKYDIVFLMSSDEIIEFSWYIVDITGVRGLCDKARDSFTTSETDRAFC